MIKYYHFLCDSPLNQTTFNEVLKSSYHGDLDVFMLDAYQGYCVAGPDFVDTLEGVLPLLVNDLGISITFLVSHNNSNLSHLALTKANKEQCTHLSDIVLECIVNHDYTFVPEMKKEFEHISHEIMMTAEMFVKCGMNASLAARKLYIHRNTFTYRLLKFINQTNLDIRDYYNAQYFTYCIKLI